MLTELLTIAKVCEIAQMISIIWKLFGLISVILSPGEYVSLGSVVFVTGASGTDLDSSRLWRCQNLSMYIISREHTISGMQLWSLAAHFDKRKYFVEP